MALSDAQKTIAFSTKRFRVAVCGRRFGKTFLAIRELAKFARLPGQRIWYVAPTRAQGKGIVWDQLKQRLGELNWIKRINESDLAITLINGSIIEIKSGDAYERMRGFSVDFIVFDEFADIDEDAWTVVRPALADKQGHALFIGTPKGNQNWARNIYDMSLSNTDWASFSYTTLDGGRVPDWEVEAAKKEMDVRLFRQEFLATFEDAGNQVFYSWNRSDNMVPYTGPAPAQLYIGMDFNVGKMCALVGVRIGETMHIIDEIVLPSSNTDEMVSEIRTRYRHLSPDRIWVYPDPASRQNRSSAGGRTDLSILQNAGFTVKCPNSHNPIRDGVNAVNSRLCSATGDHYLFVDPKNKYTIESLERLSYKQGSNQPDKDSGYDHMADALRYLIEFIWPVRRVIEPRPAQRWGMRMA